MRSSSWKNGRFASLTAIPTTTLSNSAEARRTRSWWPRVTGSNVPGYTALIIDLPCQEMKMHVPRARALENGPAAVGHEGRCALYVHPRVRREQPAHPSQHGGLKTEAIRRIEQYRVQPRARFPGEF